jgi:methionyl-tRNA formyltransferase
MRIAVFPTKRIGRESLSFLLERYPDDIQLIVYENKDCPLFKEFGHIKPCLFYDNVYNEIGYITSLNLDWIFLTWWPHIIKREIINVPKYGVINTHNSLLPFNRGVHPNFWAIVEEKPYGVSIHKVTPGVDDGDVISQVEIPYDWTINGDELYEFGMRALTKLFQDTYPKIRHNNYTSTIQNHKNMTCHKTFEIDDISKINLDDSYKARDLINIIRAKDCLGKPVATFDDQGKTYEVRIQISTLSSSDES